MKTIVLTALLSLMLVFASPVCQAQSAMLDEQTEQTVEPTPNKPTVQENKSFFGRIFDKLKGNSIELLVTFIVGIFAKHGWTQAIKRFASRATVITKELSELLAATSDGLKTIDDNLKTDGKLKENSLDEILEAKKKLVVELNDVILSIKPKNL